MLKKFALGLLAVIFAATFSFAQTVRNPPATTQSTEGKTNVGSIGVQGLDVSGNPGYFEITGTGGVGEEEVFTYYLWVDRTGDLRIASYADILGTAALTTRFGASFPTGNWRLPNFNVGSVVGGQS